MKTWFAQFKKSCALDDVGVHLKPSPEDPTESDSVREFEQAAKSLDRRLKSSPPTGEPPAGLHGSVMQAVRGAARTGKQTSPRLMLRWLPAPAFALLVVAGLWWVLNQPANPPPKLTMAVTTLEQSHQLAQQAPAAALAPLSKEMEALNRDLRNAVEILLASVP